MNKIELQNVSKRFKQRELFSNVNLVLESGKIYGLIGANGSGKSVLFKLIVGLVKPTSGEIFYNQEQLHQSIEILPSVGIVVDSPQFYENLSGYENLYLLASINQIIKEEQIEETLNLVGLSHDRLPVKKYSLGMRQRLALAQAIMEDPDVLLLDEITNGIDKTGIKEIYRIIENEKEKGKIILITSHRSQDIQALCDVVFEIDAMEVKQVDKTEI